MSTRGRGRGRGRPRSKSVYIERNISDDSDVEVLDPVKRKRVPVAAKDLVQSDSDSESQARGSRMRPDEEDIFIKKCVEHFDDINVMSTMRGLPTSTGPKLNRDKRINEAWAKIATEMNEITKVSLPANHSIVYCFQCL